MNLLSFCFYVLSLFCLHFAKIVLLDIRFLVGTFFLLSAYFFVEKSAVNLIGAPLYVMRHFSLTVSNILPLSLSFNFLSMVHGYGSLCGYQSLLNLLDIQIGVLHQIGMFSAIISSFFSAPFSFSSPSRIPISHILMHLKASHISLKLSLFFSIIFSPLLLSLHNLYQSILSFMDSLSYKLESPVKPFSDLFTSVIIFSNSRIFIWIFLNDFYHLM